MDSGMWPPAGHRVGAAIAVAFAAVVAPSRMPAQAATPSEGRAGWSYYVTGNVSPWGFHELALDPTYGAAIGMLRETGTTFEFGVEALYERLAPQSGVNTYFYCQPDAIECLSSPAPCSIDAPGCIREDNATAFSSEKAQLIGIARLRAWRGAVRPYAESSMGVYYASSRDKGSVVYSGAASGTDQWDYPSSGIGLLLGLGGGLELPVGRRFTLLFLSRLHAQLGDEASRLTPTFGLGLRLE
jgi:hypothetical protein